MSQARTRFLQVEGMPGRPSTAATEPWDSHYYSDVFIHKVFIWAYIEEKKKIPMLVGLVSGQKEFPLESRLAYTCCPSPPWK